MNLLERLTKETLLADGAMGTMLHSRGISFDKCFDELNLTQPEAVAEVHRAYVESGAQLILTNTFGANRFKLGKHGLAKQVVEINRAGVELARRVAAASSKEVLVAGDVGPLGVRIAPFGRVQPEQARAAFVEQISALCEAGADLIVIETMNDLYEIKEAVKAEKEACSLLVVASVTFTRDDRTVLGDDPMKVARTLKEAGADVIGVNCSGGPTQLLRLLKQMVQAVPDGKFWVKPNAGWPEQAPLDAIVVTAAAAPVPSEITPSRRAFITAATCGESASTVSGLTRSRSAPSRSCTSSIRCGGTRTPWFAKVP